MNLFVHRIRLTGAPPVSMAFALALSLATCGGLIAANRWHHLGPTTVALVFLLPVGISATYWGLFPGLGAATTSFLAFNYYFIEPTQRLAVRKTEDLVVLVAFWGVAAVISELAARVRRNLDAAISREQDTTRLYELGMALARLRDEKDMGKVLMDKVIDTLQADRVEIELEGGAEPTFLARGMVFTHKPDLLIPLQATRGLVGEIRLWRERPRIQAAEERILHTFASQSILAIERVRLSNADRKAQVSEESDRMKSSLLSSVSHELRSPLAAIKASVSSLRSEAVEWESQARADLLETIEEEVDHLNILVGNLLDMSRIEAGALNPQKKPNLLAEIMGVVTVRMRKQMQGYQQCIDVPDDLPLVNVDFVQIEQVFTNLLSNSLKYSPPGSIIHVSARLKDDEHLLVTIKNQSTPLPEEDLGKIFDKFYRLNPSERVVGSGLGLSICKGIIEAHGGRIWAENVSDGIAFHFLLPV